MVQKARAIVLHHLNYGDTSIIVHLYTDLYGRISVMVKGARGQRKNRKISLYHPLALLELEINYKENRDIQQLKEARPHPPLQGIMADPIKSTVALFLSELFYKTIRENAPNAELFEYLQHTIQYFDLTSEGISVFHLFVMIQLTRFLGFRPQAPETEAPYWFDMETGTFSLIRPIKENRIDPSLSFWLIRLLKCSPDETGQIKITKSERNELIEYLLRFYHLQMDGMGELKSFSVLKAVFS